MSWSWKDVEPKGDPAPADPPPMSAEPDESADLAQLLAGIAVAIGELDRAVRKHFARFDALDQAQPLPGQMSDRIDGLEAQLQAMDAKLTAQMERNEDLEHRLEGQLNANAKLRGRARTRKGQKAAKVTSEDQALVDEAVQQGRVTKLPDGHAMGVGNSWEDLAR